MMNPPRVGRAAAALTLAAALAGCGSPAATTAAPAAGTGGPDSLRGICPETVTVQTDWYPESEHAEFYQLTGPGAEEDDAGKRYTSPLYTPAGVDTGVKIQIRAGGPAIGFQQATAQMYADDDILIAISPIDQIIQNSAKFPTVAIIAPRKTSPQIIMWDPARHPDWKTIADIGRTDTTVQYFGGAAYMDYLTGAGILKQSQVDGSYDGNPARWVSSGGDIAQQGYITAEPFQYANEIEQWRKPVAYQLIADTGFNAFPADVVKPDSIEKYADCLTKLVPLFQRAEIAYLADPARVNQLVSDLTTRYEGPEYTRQVADYAAKVQIEKGIVGNIAGTGLGGFDTTAVQGLIDKARPIFTAQDNAPPAGLTAATITTNRFIDPGVQLP
jgi:hypothetical protein